jgi:hypothetical protein
MEREGRENHEGGERKLTRAPAKGRNKLRQQDNRAGSGDKDKGHMA